MRKFWREHEIVVVGIIISCVFFGILSVLQTKGSIILNLETKWLILAIIPIFIAMFIGGYIKSFKGFGIELEAKLKIPLTTIKLKAKEAATTLVGNYKESIKSLDNINNNQKDKIKLLIFISGKKDYYGSEAIQIYLDGLQKLEYILINDKDDKFVCLLPITVLTKSQNNINKSRDINKFIDALERNSIQSEYMNICIDNTIKKNENILDTLLKMRTLKIKSIAVLDSDNKFYGLLNETEIEHKIIEEVISYKRA